MMKIMVAELKKKKKRTVNNILDKAENWIRQRTTWLFSENNLEKWKQGENIGVVHNRNRSEITRDPSY